VKKSEKITEWKGGGSFKSEVLFLFAEAPLVAYEKGLSLKKVMEGYLKGLEKRASLPRGWDKPSLQKIANFIIRYSPTVRVTNVLNSKGDEVPFAMVRYDEEVPCFLGVRGFVTDIETARSKDWTWLKILV
jgi:hypothetical protein